MRKQSTREKVKFTISTLYTLFVMLISVSPAPLEANVSGQCSTCHTMHDSQDAGSVARSGSGTGWNASSQLTGGSLQGPVKNLTVSTCAGCHTSTTDQTIITVDSSSIPIVFNTAVPSSPLAGGNFYWVAQGDDTKGHNVYDIASQDSNLGSAPGFTSGACMSAGRCHVSLAVAPSGTNWNRGGCQGCHVFTYHHDDNGVYRFLKGHGASIGSTLGDARKDINNYPDYVKGVEDDDWEQETITDHNYYSGTNNTYSSDGNALTNQQTITAFCSGCHGDFHGPVSGDDGMGSSSPWIRHPTDILLPQTGVYGNYDPVGSYNAEEAPVGWVTPSSPARAEAVVICLSCHRAHGSPYPDMLRWDYSTIVVGSGGSDGCFICHSDKN